MGNLYKHYGTKRVIRYVDWPTYKKLLSDSRMPADFRGGEGCQRIDIDIPEFECPKGFYKVDVCVAEVNFCQWDFRKHCSEPQIRCCYNKIK